MALTLRQRQFVQEYLVDLNATQAAIRAGYSEKTAEVIGYENLRKPQIKAAIDRAIQARNQRTEITQDKVIQELAKVAFADGTMYARVVGGGRAVELTDTAKLTADQRAAISCVKEGKYGIEVSTYDKVRALELLGKHLGVFDSRGGKPLSKENNLLEAIMNTEEIDTDDLPEVE
ncbi:MAG: terminase small subunit [Oscillospiraceae bacterium]|nr:terminase small subunit [Oscillospiraceae bacterium]